MGLRCYASSLNAGSSKRAGGRYCASNLLNVLSLLNLKKGLPQFTGQQTLASERLMRRNGNSDSGHLGCRSEAPAHANRLLS